MQINKIVTIERFLLDTQPHYARGDLTALLCDLALAAKIIAAQTRRAGLLDTLGFADQINVQGEAQRKLDVYADELIVRLTDHTGRLCAMVSEERADWIPIPARYPKGDYVLVFDPLDGSSNIDSNISVGTIFGIYRTLDRARRGRLQDCLQPGKDLVAAGYVLYGTSTLMVFSTGQGVHEFTLDPAWGEFLLSRENMRFPDKPKYYSFNLASADRWSKEMKAYVDWLASSRSPVLSQRYVGSMVADFHRNLIHGGVFGYPDEYNKPDGKIRLLYEAAPLAFLADQAGGYGSDGRRDLLAIQPVDIHQRTPVFVGNRDLVKQAEAFLSQD